MKAQIPALPAAPESERLVLGALLLGNAEAPTLFHELSPSDFFTPRYQAIFRRAKELAEAGLKPDLVLLADSLSHDDLERAGGIEEIARLVDGMPRVFDARAHADVLRQKSRLRRAAMAAERIQGLAITANGNGAEVLQEIGEIVSAHLREEVGQKRILSFKSGADLAAQTAEAVEWISRGLVARGAITELGGKVKSGKSTFILDLVRAALDGRPFLDAPTAKTSTVYLTEQPPVSFRQAMERAGLLGRRDFLVLAHGEVRGLVWPDIAAAAIEECKQKGAGLLVVDTLPQFAGLAGEQENNSGDALEAMRPIQRAANEGIAVVLVRHERKSGGDVGDSGRGSSAFAGAVDIVLSLRRPEGNQRKTVRLLQALSRFSETQPDLLVELVEAGGRPAYISLGAPREAAQKEAEEAIRELAPRSEVDAQTLKELAETIKEPRATVQRAVDALAEEGVLSRIGAGKKGNPFRYFIPENPGQIRFCPTSDTYGQKQIELPTAEGGDA